MATEQPLVSHLSDALAHFMAGVFVSVLDFFTSRVSEKKADRIESLKQCLVSIDSILSSRPGAGNEAASPPPLDRGSMQYALNIHAVKAYFIRSGIIKENVPLASKIGGFFKNEKINNLTFMQKVYLTLGLELTDTFIGISYYASFMHSGPVGSLMLNIYQMPLFLAGLYAGKYLICSPIEWLTTLGEEQKMQKAIENAAKNTPIVDTVLSYKPPEQVAIDLKAQGKAFSAIRLTERGKNFYRTVQTMAGDVVSSVGETAKKVAGSVSEYAQREVRKAEEEKQAARDKFNDLTKGR